MAARYGKADAEKCFVRLVKVMRGRRAKAYNDVGGLRLDYNPIYGGVNVEEIMTETGAVTQPFGILRQKPEAFCASVRMAEETVRYRKGRRSRRTRTGG